MINKKQKQYLLSSIRSIDVKSLEIDGVDEDKKKWFRFGSFTALKIIFGVIESMSEEDTSSPTERRHKFQDKNYAIDIMCPEHVTHGATLYTFGHRFAGIWTCSVEDLSGECPHYDTVTKQSDDGVHEYQECILDEVAVYDTTL